MQKGHHLIVVTNAGEVETEAEKEAAKSLTETCPGSVRVLQPGDDWVLDNLDTIIGMVPEMIDDAVKFKATWNALLILVANSKIAYGEQNFGWLTENTSELWSLGPNVFDYHQQILDQMQLNLEHKPISLLPDFEPLVDRRRVYSRRQHCKSCLALAREHALHHYWKETATNRKCL